MKSSLRMSFLLGLTLFSMAAHGDFFQSTCSNAERTVAYHVQDSNEFLSVAFNSPGEQAFQQQLFQSARSLASSPGIKTLQMKDVRDFVAREVAEPVIIAPGTFTTNTCDGLDTGMGTLRMEMLAVRKVQFEKADGSLFDSDIVALDKGGKTITVDYLCESIEEMTVLCSDLNE